MSTTFLSQKKKCLNESDAHAARISMHLVAQTRSLLQRQKKRAQGKCIGFFAMLMNSRRGLVANGAVTQAV